MAHAFYGSRRESHFRLNLPHYLTLPGPSWIASTPALWLSVTGRSLSYVMIAERIRDYALQAEVKASVHTRAITQS
jgi:hypothetical protein